MASKGHKTDKKEQLLEVEREETTSRNERMHTRQMFEFINIMGVH